MHPKYESASLRARTTLALLALVAAHVAVAAEPAAATNLVTQRIDAGQRAVLPGHRLAWANAANDRGVVPAGQTLTNLQILLKRSPERQRAFDAYLREQQDPASPNYRRWLTPGEIGERFGATAADIDAISDWLRSRGLAVDAVSNSRMRIRFSGSAATVAAAFDTQLHYYTAGTGTTRRMAPSSEPQIPQALAGAVESVLGLSPPRFVPQHRSRVLRSTPAGSVQPALTTCDSGVCSHYVTPGDFAKIYGVPGAQTADGSGQTIAILGRARVYNTDIQNFGARTKVTMKTPTVVIPPDGVDPGAAATTCSTTGTPSCSDPSDLVQEQSEVTLDVTRAGSVAPGAQIKLIVSGDKAGVDGLNYALDYAIDNDPPPANIVSISFSSCEAANSQSVANGLDQLFAQGAMEGISVFVASGDAGAADCAKYFAAPTAGLALSTNVICASGHVTCVGGTGFRDGTDGYWTGPNTPQSGYVSAAGYIPEGAWNEPQDDDGNPQVAASGGGISSYIARPSWQTGTGVGTSARRYVPDVSFVASQKHGYFGCMAASQGPCAPEADGSFRFLAWGGTSASAPSMAGVAALLNQNAGGAQGSLNPRLYALAAKAGSAVFHDVSVASSGVANCSVSTPSLCNNSLPGTGGLAGGLAGYVVGTGYDPVTGLGSIDVGRLLSQWSSVSDGINPDQHGITGPWADPSTSSQGLVIEVYPDYNGAGTGTLFGGWFTFDTTAAGGLRWYTVQGLVRNSASTSTATIYNSTGGRFDSSQAASTVAVGDAAIRFADCGHATLDYRFDDGRSGTFDLARVTQPITCGPDGDNGTPASNYLLSGAWADPGNSAQGLIVDVNPTQKSFFAAWYTFAASATPSGGATAQRWFTLQAAMTPGTRQLNNVPIYVSGGGVFGQQTNTTLEQVGHADLVFRDCAHATLTYAFRSGSGFPSSGTLDLTRVGPVPTGCSL